MSRSRRVKDEDYDMGGYDQEQQDLSYASLTAGTKRCNCKKARCLKLYCVCFAAGVFCSGCACRECLNAVETADLVHAERSKKLAASPGAFAPKVEAKGEGELAHKKGCRCRRSRCVKKYCECYDAQVFCSGNCRCEQCQNMPRGGAPPPGLPPALLQHHHAGLAGAPMPLTLTGTLPGGLLPPQLLLRSGSGAAAAASGGFNLAALAAATGAGASSNGMAEPTGASAASAAPMMATGGSGVSTAAAAAAAALMLEKAFGGQPLVDPLADMEAGADAADPLVSPPDPAAGHGGSSAGTGGAAAPGGAEAGGQGGAAAGLSERSGLAGGVPGGGAAVGPPAVAAPRPGLAASLAGLGINLDSPSLASITAAAAVVAGAPTAAVTNTAAPAAPGDGTAMAAAQALAAGVAVGALPGRWSVPFLNSPDTATAAAAAAMVAEEGTGGPASQDAPGATRNPFSTAFMSRAAAEAAAVAVGTGGSSDLDATRQRGSSGGSAGGCSSDGAEGGVAPGQAPGCMGRDAARERATRRSSSDPEDAGPEDGSRRDRGGIDGAGSALPLMPAPAGDPAAVAAANAGINLSVAPLTLPSALALVPGGMGGGGAAAADSVAALQDMASAAALAAASAAAAAAQSVATAIEARNASGGGAAGSVPGASAAGLPHGVLAAGMPGTAGSGDGGAAAAAAAAATALAAGEPLTLEMVVAAPALLLDDPARAEEVAVRVGLDATLQLAARKAAHILKSLLQMAQRACLASQLMGATPAATGTTAAAPGTSAMGVGASGFQADAALQQQQASAGFPGFPVPAPSAAQLAATAAAPQPTAHDPLQLHQQLQAYASGSGALGQLPSLQHLTVPPLPAPARLADNCSHMSYSHTHQATQGQGMQHTQPSLHAPLPSLQAQPSGTAAVGSVGGGGAAAAPASSNLPAGSQLQVQPSGGIRPLHRTGSGGGAMRLGSGSFRFGGGAGLTAAAVRPEPSAADQPSAAHHTLRTSNHSTAHPGRRASELGQPPLSATGAGARSGAGFAPSNSAQRYHHHHHHHSHRRQSDATNGGGGDAGGGGLRRGSRVKRPNSLLADMEIHNDLDPDFDPSADPDAGAARRQHHAAHLPAASDRRLPHTSYIFGAGGATLSRGRSSAEPPSPKRSRLLGEEGAGGRRGAAARRRRRGGRGGGAGAGYDSGLTSEDEDDLIAEVEEEEERETWGQRRRAASVRGISQQSPMQRHSELSNGPLSSGGGGSALLPHSLLGTNGGPKPNSIISPFGASFGTHHAYGGPTGSLLSGGARPTTSEARTGAAGAGRKRRLSSGTAPRRISIDAHDVDFLGGAMLSTGPRGGGGPQRSCGLAAAEVDGLGLGGLGADGDSSELEAMQALVGLATAH